MSSRRARHVLGGFRAFAMAAFTAMAIVLGGEASAGYRRARKRSSSIQRCSISAR